MTRQYMESKGTKTVGLQIVGALIATFLKRGKGRFRVVDTNEEGSEFDFYEEEELVKPTVAAVYARFDRSCEETHVYYKPYLTWSAKGRVGEPLQANFEESFVYYKEWTRP